MLTLEHKEVLRDLRQKLGIHEFDGTMDEDDIAKVEAMFKEIETEYENN